MKRGIALFVILVLVASAALVLAQRQNPPARPMAGRMGARAEMGPMMFEKMKKELNLTPDQVTQIQAIHKDFMDSTQSVRDQIKDKMKQMSDLWMADAPDAAAIKDLASQIDPLRAQVRDAAIDHMISGLAVLTPDQKAKVKDWMKKNPHMMMGMGCGISCGAGMSCGMGKGPSGGCSCMMK